MISNNKCKKCGYAWASKVFNPKSCPNCKSYKWKVENKIGVEE